jgi:hypothetical protein
MATAKKKKEVKVRDLKPSKDAKGGAHRNIDTAQRRDSAASAARGGASRSLAGRTLQ